MDIANDIKADAPIVIEGLQKSYGAKIALQGVSAQISASGVTAILGKNGAGKTTLIKCCLGLEKISGGKVAIFGHKPGSRKARQSLGIMLQDTELPDLLTGSELITLFSSYYDNPLGFDEVISLTQIGEFKDKRYKKLSGGQKRRIQFALAITGDPDILFLDEPTTGLDTEARKALWETVRRFAESGKTIILTTHYLEEADTLADRIIILNDGRIVEDAPTREIQSRLGGDMIRCQTSLSLAQARAVSACLTAERSGKFTVLRTVNAATTLRDLLARDPDLSDLTVARPSLEEIFSEGTL